jgi:superfamily I DNA/RNA helicase
MLRAMDGIHTSAGRTAGPELNPDQQRALDVMDEAPLRVIAGPGTGKSTTVVAMYLRLLEESNLRPGQVLLLTFATNAASDLKRRIDALHTASYDESWVSTFHSFATRVLTTYGHLHGIPAFRLMNGFEEKVLMRHVLSLAPPLEVLEPLRGSEALVQDALWFIGILKQNLVRSDDVAALAARSGGAKVRDLAAIYAAYWREQDARHLWDFRDVIAQCQLLLERNDALRAQLSDKFRHVIVDEYQDVDAAQVKLIAQLVQGHTPHPRLAVVGDPNQSIFSFRGTLPAFLDDAWQWGGNRVELRQNYRSFAPILAGSDDLLRRYGLPAPGLTPLRGRPDVPVVLRDREQNGTDEATAVVRQVAALVSARDGTGARYRPGDVAIILRSVRRHGRQFEEALRAAGIPHEVGASPTFASSDIVRFAIDGLQALAQPDNDRHLVRVLASPFAGVPAADAHRLLAEADRRRRAAADTLHDTSLLTVLKHTCFLLHDADAQRWPLPWNDSEPPLSPHSRAELQQQQAAAEALDVNSKEPVAARRPVAGFFELLTDDGRAAIHGFTWRWARLRTLSDELPVDALLHRLLDDLGVMRELMSATMPDDRRNQLLGPLRMLLRAVADHAEFQSLLSEDPPSLATTVAALEQLLPEHIDELAAPDHPERGVVRILTAHASKGLEFPVVFMPAMAALHFPVVPGARSPLLGRDDQRWLTDSLPDFAAPWPASDGEFLREEARLGYVAATRARDMLFLSWADTYEKDEVAAPSAFVEPLTGDGPLREYTELQRNPALGGAAAAASGEEVAAFAGWQPWAEPVVRTPGSQDSASSISKFLACPRQYYYSKTMDLRTESGVAAARGSAFHKALEHFHSPDNESRWRHSADLSAHLYGECCDAAIADHLRTIEGKLSRRVERDGLKRLFKQYWESEIEGKTVPTTVATEVGFAWHPLNDVTIRGWIDRIIELDDGGHEIIDYKTGRQGITQPELARRLGLTGEAPRDFQLLIYFFGSRDGEVSGISQVEPHIVALWYPSQVMKRPPGIRKTQISVADAIDAESKATKPDPTVLDPEALAGAHGRIVATIEEIRAGAYPPSPRHDEYTCLAAWGKGCDYAWVCPGRVDEPEDYEAQ